MKLSPETLFKGFLAKEDSRQLYVLIRKDRFRMRTNYRMSLFTDSIGTAAIYYVNIANNLNTTLVTRVTPLDYGCSARELVKLPPNKPEQAYRMAPKMALHDRQLSLSPRLMAKVVKKILEDPTTEADSDGEGQVQEERRWLNLTY